MTAMPFVRPDAAAPGPCGLPRYRERGMAESVQWAVLMPLVLVIILGTVGICQLLAGRSAVQEAAYAGAESGAIWNGDHAKANQAAQAVAQTGGLRQIQISVTDAGDQIVVDVVAQVQTFLPNGIDPTVRGHATRPKEGGS